MLIYILLAFLPYVAGQTCPNRCSGHGFCSADARLRCTCVEGFFGNDCSLRSCPHALAWVGTVVDDDDAHDHPAECSGVGECNRQTGKCKCQAGFEGPACERLICPGTNQCSNHGRCFSLREAALGYDGFELQNFPVNYDNWDADRIFGCVCDPLYTGHDCSVLKCPSGDNPLTPGLPEIQTIECHCVSGCTSGGFTIEFGGRSAVVLHNAVATKAEESILSPYGSGSAVGESIESLINSLRPYPLVSSVVFDAPLGTACGPTQKITVTYLNSAGDVPQILVTPGTLIDASSFPPTVVASTVREATTERIPCSGTGSCNSNDGTCSCLPGFYSSDGNGGLGDIPDCGSMVNPVTEILEPVTTCPLPQCGGNGVCRTDGGIARCECFAGYTGGACTTRLCPSGRAWFDEPTTSTRAHALQECSNAGKCDRITGRCLCRPGFSGSACDRLQCPTSDLSATCSGHGRCLALQQLAELARQDGWPIGETEEQVIECGLISGDFTLTFGGLTTTPFSYASTISEVIVALEALPGVGPLAVRTDPPHETLLCSGAPTRTYIDFTTRRTPSPLLTVTYITPGVGPLSISLSRPLSRVGYGRTPSDETWDAFHFRACACDPGWTGESCNLRTCAEGHDSEMEAGRCVGRAFPEVQKLTCSGFTGGASGQYFNLGFRGLTSENIAVDATVRELQAALEKLSTVGTLMISAELPNEDFLEYDFHLKDPDVLDELVCASDDRPLYISFKKMLGNLPLLRVDEYGLSYNGPGFPVASVVVEEFRNGNDDSLLECAGRGMCDGNTGLCKCLPGWFSSDGFSRPGTRGDCGVYNPLADRT